MLRKKWIAREDLSDVRDASRTIQIATLKEVEGKLNANQQTIVDYLRQPGRPTRPGRSPARAGRSAHDVADAGAARHRRAERRSRPSFHMSGMKPRKLEFLFTPAQKDGARRDHRCRRRAQVPAHAAARRHRLGQDRRVSCRRCRRCWPRAARRSCWFRRSGSPRPWPPICTRSSATRSPSCTPALSDDERAEQWKRIRNGESHIVVGTRSAIFAPVPDLALIVVDEEHDHSYKQEEMPRYHARDVAVMRAKMCNAAVVLGSATPSLETYYNAVQGKYRAAGAAGAHREAAAARGRNPRHARGVPAHQERRSRSRASWWRKSASGWRATSR